MNLAILQNRLSGTYGSVRLSMGEALAWWLAELTGLVPAGVREIGHARDKRLLVDLDDGLVNFTLQDKSGTRSIAQLAGAIDAAEAPAEVSELSRSRGARTVDVAVRVAPERAVRRTVVLPLAAERNLDSVLGFELDRYTPFKAEQVYYGSVIEGRDRAKGTLQVGLTVVVRREVDPLLDRLREWGLAPSVLEIRDSGASRLNLLPVARAEARSRTAMWRDRLLLVLALVLLVAVIFVSLKQKMDVAEDLERQVAAAREQALQAERVREELKQITDEEVAIVERRRQRASPIEVLDEISRLLPDSAWLNRIEINDGRVTIRGEAANASELVKLLEGSGRFRNAAFEGALTRDARTERERFSISAQAVVKP